MPIEITPDQARVFSGQLEGLASGTPYQFPNADCNRAILGAHPDNVGTSWVGFETGTLSGDSGFPLMALGPYLAIEGLDNLDFLVATFDVANDKICWLITREL
ncbi:MAG: hypothetical protein GTN64_05735 [Candidatus Latescibacteria bacterium]|nr:hypothetical protein [Candidatus Latescibacterota bacterium]NIO78110.1 hypothetical protein [Candidatus Latescibacterota bacterium]